MMNLIRVLAACLLLITLPALAVVPEQGIWWNPQQSGRGYGIEVQDNMLYVTYYAYDESRNSTFYTSLGYLDVETGTVQAYFAGSDDGQCFGCSYRKPKVSDLGDAVFRFTSMTTGSITLPGGVVIPIERLALLGTEPNAALLGTWHLTTAIGSIYFGDMIALRDTWSGKDGGLQGNILGDPGRPIIGAPLNDGSGRVLLLEDSSPNYYTAYVFRWAQNRFVGYSWTFLKTSEMDGPGSPFFASRVAGKTVTQRMLGISASSTADSPPPSQSAQIPDKNLPDLDAVMAARSVARKSAICMSCLTGSVPAGKEHVDLVRVRNLVSALELRMSVAKENHQARD